MRYWIILLYSGDLDPEAQPELLLSAPPERDQETTLGRASGCHSGGALRSTPVVHPPGTIRMVSECHSDGAPRGLKNNDFY